MSATTSHQHHEDEEQQETGRRHGDGARALLDLIGFHQQLSDSGEQLTATKAPTPIAVPTDPPPARVDPAMEAETNNSSIDSAIAGAALMTIASWSWQGDRSVAGRPDSALLS